MNVLLSTILIEPVAILIEPTICVILNFKLLCRKSVCVGKVKNKYQSMALFDFLRSLTPFKLYVLVLCLLAYFLNQLDR